MLSPLCIREVGTAARFGELSGRLGGVGGRGGGTEDAVDSCNLFAASLDIMKKLSFLAYLQHIQQQKSHSWITMQECANTD